MTALFENGPESLRLAAEAQLLRVRKDLAYSAVTKEDGLALSTARDYYRDAALAAHASEMEAATKPLVRALRNCLLMARRAQAYDHPESPRWTNIVRFCSEAGVESSILRDEANLEGREP